MAFRVFTPKNITVADGSIHSVLVDIAPLNPGFNTMEEAEKWVTGGMQWGQKGITYTIFEIKWHG